MDYDQIAFRTREGSLDRTGNAGVFDFFRIVYRDDDETSYVSNMPIYKDQKSCYEYDDDGKERSPLGKTRYYREWRTHQMSDHFPMWVELKIDYSDEYLKDKLAKQPS